MVTSIQKSVTFILHHTLTVDKEKYMVLGRFVHVDHCLLLFSYGPLSNDTMYSLSFSGPLLQNMGPWYEFICENNPEAFVLDGAMLKAMKLANAETLKELDAAIVEAEKDGGGERKLCIY